MRGGGGVVVNDWVSRSQHKGNAFCHSIVVGVFMTRGISTELHTAPRQAIIRFPVVHLV